ncbi:MAG TPA: MBL fold metallo-hydrolase [Bryobacteraceae bacterium]|nr:MBL fold metallo-hydrolase [Bryobacteraceae bacterium]
MLRRLAAVLLFSVLLFVAARGQADRVRELAPGVYFWQGDRDKRQPANCTWVVFKDYVLVIDANFPWGAREILPAIKSTTSKPIRFLFDTHYHGDHAYGNSLFADAGATIICSEVCAEELRTKGARGWNNWKDPEHSLAGARLEPPAITFTDGMVFDDGKQRVEITRVGPAHSKGDAVAYLPKQRIVVTGDLCVTWRSGNNVADADADHANWIKVLERISHWDVMTVIPGHGTPAAVSSLMQQREYLSDMLNQVQAGKRAGKSADELAKEIDLSKHGSLGANAEANASSVRAVYRRLGPG